MHFFTCFLLGDFTFSITAQKRFGLLEKRKRINHPYDISFIRYVIDYCGATPDHRVQALIKFQTGVFSFNGDVIWLLRIDYSLRIPMDVGLCI